MKKILIISILLFSSFLQAQITLIPDSGFESFLVVQDIDTDGEINGQVLTSDIENVTWLHLHQPYHTISDMTGIEDFTALEDLSIWQQDFTSINLTNNLNLTDLNLSTIPLVNLDISNNINLIELDLLTNTLSELDLSNNINIIDLYLNAPIMSFFDLNINLNIEWMILSSTLLTEIDISSYLDISIFELYANHDLHYVNLQNGNNETTLFRAKINFSNENVICVQVDDPEGVIEGNPPYDNWDIDESITISDDCSLGVREYIENQISIYPNPVQNLLYIENNSGYSIYAIKLYDVLGRLVLQESNPSNQIDMSSLNSGLLFVQLETDKGLITKKVIKE